jgi:hypothetical protein
MNERIRELVKQSGGEFWQRLENDVVKENAYITFDPPESLEKFVELIVRECAKTVNDTEYPYEDPAHKETWDACCVWSAAKLKEHFGVE